MKKFLYLIIFFTVTVFAQDNKENYWLDPEGKEIKDKFMANLAKTYPDNSMAFRKTTDSGTVYQYNSPKYSTYKVDYKIIKAEIEKITNRTYSDSTLFNQFQLSR